MSINYFQDVHLLANIKQTSNPKNIPLSNTTRWNLDYICGFHNEKI